MGLRQWSHASHNNPRRRIEELRNQLAALFEGPQTEQSKQAASDLRAELEKTYTDEDTFWRQRSKVTWAREGDRNTSFFHSIATTRKEKNMIHGL